MLSHSFWSAWFWFSAVTCRFDTQLLQNSILLSLFKACSITILMKARCCLWLLVCSEFLINERDILNYTKDQATKLNSKKVWNYANLCLHWISNIVTTEKDFKKPFRYKEQEFRFKWTKPCGDDTNTTEVCTLKRMNRLQTVAACLKAPRYF